MCLCRVGVVRGQAFNQKHQCKRANKKSCISLTSFKLKNWNP